MDVKVTNKDAKALVYLFGSIDIPAAEKLKKSLTQILENNVTKDVVIDFGGVNFIGSSGIGKLMLFHKKFTSKGGKVQIVNVNPEITQLFRAIKLDQLFNI